MKTSPASSRHLSIFFIDMHYHLEQTGLFSKIGLKKTGRPQCSLIVFCSLSDASITQTEVATVLERVWNEAPLGYGGRKDSIKLTMLTGEVQMWFTTSTEEIVVTGCIEVYGFK